MLRYALATLVALAGISPSLLAEDEVFSGPQVGESLTPFSVQQVLGDAAGEEIDLVQNADGKPIAIIFVHEVTRPSVGLTRIVMNYAAKRKKDGLNAGVVFLTEDPTDTENWMKRASRALPKDVPVAISLEGVEGPGAYGLNRNVTMTVLVGKNGKATANMALVQPSIQADAPRIVKAIVDVLGGGKVPTLRELGVQRYERPDKKRPDKKRPDKKQANSAGRGGLPPELTTLVRAMIQKSATTEEVESNAGKIEAYLAQHEEARQTVGEIASRIIRSGRLENYGTSAAQKQLTKWAKKYGPKPDGE